MNKNVRHFRSSKKSKRTIYNQRGTCNFNDITRQVWEDFYQRKICSKVDVGLVRALYGRVYCTEGCGRQTGNLQEILGTDYSLSE